MEKIKKITNNVKLKYNQKEEVQEFSRLVKLGFYDFEERFLNNFLIPNAKVLNVGCGAGREAIALSKKKFKVVCFDFSINMVFEAIKNIKNCIDKISIMQMDATQMGIKANSFDACIMLGQLIAWIPKREQRIKLLIECKEILKPGGVLIFSTHSRKYKLKYKIYFSIVNPFRKMLSILNIKNTLEPNDRYAKQVSAVKSKGKCFLHHYSMKEAIEDIEMAGLKFIECRGTSELIKNIKDEKIREKSYLLFFAAMKNEK